MMKILALIKSLLVRFLDQHGPVCVVTLALLEHMVVGLIRNAVRAIAYECIDLKRDSR
jgi:hypothetical protein